MDEIHMPVLAVLGDLDMPSIHGIFELIATKVAGVRKAVVPGAAHMVNVEKPAAFNRILLDFLDTSERGRQSKETPTRRWRSGGERAEM
jgi:3-oxoadipate enol-lactonase